MWWSLQGWSRRGSAGHRLGARRRPAPPPTPTVRPPRGPPPAPEIPGPGPTHAPRQTAADAAARPPRAAGPPDAPPDPTPTHHDGGWRWGPRRGTGHTPAR